MTASMRSGSNSSTASPTASWSSSTISTEKARTGRRPSKLKGGPHESELRNRDRSKSLHRRHRKARQRDLLGQERGQTNLDREDQPRKRGRGEKDRGREKGVRQGPGPPQRAQAGQLQE